MKDASKSQLVRRRKMLYTIANLGLGDKSFTPPQPKFTKEMLKAQARARVVVDRQGHTALELSRDAAEATFIPMPRQGFFELYKMKLDLFDAAYKLVEPLYPTERAARLYAAYARESQATHEAMAALATLVHLSASEIEMATKEKKVSTKGKKNAVPAKKGKKSAAAAAAAEPKTVRVSSASRFRELILKPEGRTDDDIFAIVNKEFPDAKRSYVAWYRNDLKKRGQNPPAAFSAPKEEKAAEAAA